MVLHGALVWSNLILRGAKKMESPLIYASQLDVLLVEKEGQHLPKPMITVTADRATRVIISVNISSGKPRSSNSDTEL